jgi:hypothetical protein
MGSGYAKEQYRERFGQGAPAWSGEKGGECMAEGVKQFGEYEVRETASGEYELSKGGMVVGSFRSGRVDPDRAVFPLSRGTWLEVSDKGTREMLSPQKAMMGGLIASDGGSHFYYRYDQKKDSYSSQYKTSFASTNRELIDLFGGLFDAVYGQAPHRYKYPNRDLMEAYVNSKGVFYDLNDFGIKTGPFEFHVPREHLDDAGKRAYLTGFFSGDGTISRCGNQFEIRIYSKHKEGLEEMKQVLEDLGFHPNEIYTDERKRGKRIEVRHNFSIPAGEHRRFIEEIGSYKPSHRRVFKEMTEDR